MRSLAPWILPFGLTACATAPSNDLDWAPYYAPLTRVERTESSFTVSPVRDWSYNASGPTAESAYDATFDFDELRSAYFATEPQPGNDLAAHTFLIFEFEGDRLLGLTVEARMEKDEEYNVWSGVWNAYELAYVFGGARDLLTRRTIYLGHNLLIYPLTLSEEQERILLAHLLDRAEELEEKPRYYNTLFSNCTNELAKATSLRWHPSFILTGLADRHLHSVGLIAGATYDEARARADIATFVSSLNDLPPEQFDAALLAEIRRRHSPSQIADAAAPPASAPATSEP